MSAPAPFTSTTFTDGEGIDNTKLFNRVLSWLNSLLAYILSLGTGFVGETVSGSSVTLASAATKVAAAASVTWVVPAGLTGRYKITTSAQFVPASATNGRYLVQSSYNASGSVSIGSTIGVGQAIAVLTNNSLAGGGPTGSPAIGTVLLTAGTYTAYPAVTRSSGGNAADTVNTPYVLVEHVGIA
jgi:hypothetical protein